MTPTTSASSATSGGGASAWPIGERARKVHDGAIVWDGHACLPLAPGHSMADLERALEIVKGVLEAGPA